MNYKMMTTAGEGDGDGGSGLEDGERGLPILKFERDIVETVRQNEMTVVIGETGSGKTTQLAQMLLDSSTSTSSDLSAEGGSMIAVTQPRRVAAVTVARRVAWERGVRIGDEVGYSVRFEEFSSSKTRIKYLTDGMLLRETLKDPLLSKYESEGERNGERRMPKSSRTFRRRRPGTRERWWRIEFRLFFFFEGREEKPFAGDVQCETK